MDKEVFHRVAPEGTQQEAVNADITDLETFVSQLPVPNKLPETPDFSHLPAEILRSSTVETLIHQNEDLLSRLSISLRRNSSLEESVSQLEKKNRILAHKYSNMEDQLFVYKKKDQMIEGKYGKYEQTISDLKKDLKLFETQYTELYSTSQANITNLKGKIAHFSKRVGRFSRFRKRAVRLYKELKKQLNDSVAENHRLMAEVATLTETQKSIRANMASAVERIQQMDKEHQKQLADLTSGYEDQLDEQSKTIHAQSGEIQFLSAELEKANAVYEQNIDLENKVVHLDRKISEQKSQFSMEIEELQKELLENRQLAKQKVLELNSLNETVAEMEKSSSQLKTENHKLMDQVESLQTLWRDNNEQLESMKQKYSSLQKLNQQISITLNDTRKQLKNERDQKESLNFRTKDKISQLESQVRLLSRQVGEAGKGAEFSKIQPQVIHHIQSLIAEVQSGVDATVDTSEDSPSEPATSTEL